MLHLLGVWKELFLAGVISPPYSPGEECHYDFAICRVMVTSDSWVPVRSRALWLQEHPVAPRRTGRDWVSAKIMP